MHAQKCSRKLISKDSPGFHTNPEPPQAANAAANKYIKTGACSKYDRRNDCKTQKPISMQLPPPQRQKQQPQQKQQHRNPTCMHVKPPASCQCCTTPISTTTTLKLQDSLLFSQFPSQVFPWWAMPPLLWQTCSHATPQKYTLSFSEPQTCSTALCAPGPRQRLATGLQLLLQLLQQCNVCLQQPLLLQPC